MTSRDRKMEKNIKRNVEEEERLHKGKVSCLRYSGKLVMAVCGTHKIKKVLMCKSCRVMEGKMEQKAQD